MRAALVVIFVLSHVASLVDAADSVRCAKLRGEFDMADRDIARISVEAMADNSAPRETNRQLRMLRATLNKSMAVQLLIAAKCDLLPASADSSADYQASAIMCQSELLKHNYVTDKAAALCSMDGWEKNAKIPEAAAVDRVPRMPDSACQVPPCYAPPPK